MRTFDEAAVRRCVPTSLGDMALEVARICEPAEVSEDEVFTRCGVDDLAIPGRVYAAEPDLNGFAPLTQLVAATLLTRHSDGYVRQRSLEAVLEAGAGCVDAAWTAAYVVELLGDYVIEIHEVDCRPPPAQTRRWLRGA